jgi:hypothetical protein
VATCGNLIAAMCTPPPLEAIDQDHRPVLVTNGDLERPQLDVCTDLWLNRRPVSRFISTRKSATQKKGVPPLNLRIEQDVIR